MSRAVVRRYRVRFAEQGETEVTTSTVDFTLNVADLTSVPVIAGSFVHPLDGATEMRPLMVEAVDYAGALTGLLAVDQRWRAIGRVVDLQWANAEDDPDLDASWTTYGTGRCSGLDELDGPGKYRIEISDETWVARRAELFTVADTTQLWPAGIRYWWRGIKYGGWGAGTRGTIVNAVYKITCTIGTPVPNDDQAYRGIITSDIVQYAGNDALPPDDVTDEGVNFKYLRLELDTVAYRINGFGPSNGPSLETLKDAEQNNSNQFTCWVVWEGSPQAEPPAGSSAAQLYSVGPPTDRLPLHIGVRNVAWYPDHDWGTSVISSSPTDCGGYLHPADLTRRAWDAMNVRYDAANLAAIEADTSYPLLAPYVLESPEDPQKWLQSEVWGPNMLLALRDAKGRMKLADLRPPSVTTDLSAFPTLDVTNSRMHRWRIVGREACNSVVWEYYTYVGRRQAVPASALWSFSPLPKVYFVNGSTPPSGGWPSFWAQADGGPEGRRLDFVDRRSDHVGPLQSDNVAQIGLRERTFSANSWLEPLDSTYIPSQLRKVDAECATARGQADAQSFMGQLSYFLLQVYQDGPMLGTAEISGTLAETLEEGNYILVDCASVKIPNPFTAARFGKVLALVLSLTRYPAHAEIEYLIVGPALLFACPDPDDPDTWILSPLSEIATVWLGFDIPEPLSAALLTFYVQASKNATGGETVNMEVSLYLSDLTLVASWTTSDVTATATDYSFTLDSSQQALITDWSTLVLAITRNGDVGDTDPANQRRLIISGVWV